MSKRAEPSFIEACLHGNALLEEVDEFVAKWHEHPENLPLHDSLGMTKDEYALWVSEPDVLPYIVTAHRDHRPVARVIEDVSRLQMAARSDNPKQTEKLMQWLKRHGKLD